jgi:predicted P-loop ATPase
MRQIKAFIQQFIALFNNASATLSPVAQPQLSKQTKSSNTRPDPIIQLGEFLSANYLFRYNQLTGETEYKSIQSPEADYLLVTHRVLNTLCIAARLAGIDCWDRDIARYVDSEITASYHPFTSYIQALPAWDGVDRLTDLAQCVSHNGCWVKYFHRWMLATVAQWTQLNQTHGNSLTPILISSEQGLHKSTFCKSLIPNALQGYYTDQFDLASPAAAARKLTEFGLINIDEFDKCTPKNMATLKNLLQMALLNIRKSYKRSNSMTPRLASFIATSNNTQLLTDPSGSRRFLCVVVSSKIDCTAINHDQLYAQLKAELANGARHWLTNREEHEIGVNNAPFQKPSIESEVFLRCFVPGVEAESESIKLGISDIFHRLKKKNPAAMRESTVRGLAYALTLLNVPRIHTEYGNVYCLKRVDSER